MTRRKPKRFDVERWCTCTEPGCVDSANTERHVRESLAAGDWPPWLQWAPARGHQAGCQCRLCLRARALASAYARRARNPAHKPRN